MSKPVQPQVFYFRTFLRNTMLLFAKGLPDFALCRGGGLGILQHGGQRIGLRALCKAAQLADLLPVMLEQLNALQILQALLALEFHFMFDLVHDARHVLRGQVQAFGFCVQGVVVGL